MKAYITSQSPSIWILEPETELEKQVLEGHLEKQNNGRYSLRRRGKNKTVTLELIEVEK